VLQRAHQPYANALNLVTAVLGDTLETAVLHAYLRGQQGAPVPACLGQPLAQWLCKTQAVGSVQAAEARPRVALAPASRVTSRQRVGFSTQQPGEFVFKANICQVARRQVFLECPMREGVDADSTGFQYTSTVTQVLDQQGRAYLRILAQAH